MEKSKFLEKIKSPFVKGDGFIKFIASVLCVLAIFRHFSFQLFLAPYFF